MSHNKCNSSATLIGMMMLRCALSPSLWAFQQDDKAEPDRKSDALILKTEKVVVFKDGYCLIVKRGTAKTNDQGKTFTDNVPDAAVLGSFWAIPKTGTIRSMTAGWVEDEVEAKKQVTCTQVIEIIEANIGKRCSFLIDKETKVKGKIERVLTRKTSTALDQSTRNHLGIEASFASRSHLRQPVPSFPLATTTITQTIGDYFVVDTDDGDMLVRASDVKQLTIDEMNTTVEQTIHEKSKRKRLTLDFEKANENIEIVMMYFRPGVRWIPTYRVDLAEAVAEKGQAKKGNRKGKDESATKTAEVILQGEILNEAEDLIDMPIDVVVGVPNFRFRTVPSPLILESVLRNALAQAAPQIMGQQLGNNSISNALYTQRSGEFRSARASRAGDGAAIEMPKELSGAGGNDLFVYHLPKMNLKRGERATVPIMRTNVPYRDIYTWDVHVKHSETFAQTGAASQSPLVLSENKVWRQVELINDTKIPWTTGAAMFVDGFQPLAQELLTYTSPGGICRVPVTVAVDLRGKVEDSETGRKLNELKWQGYSYARVDGRIEIELANNKTEPVPVEVRLRFGGRADKASDDGVVKFEMFHKEDWHNYRSDTAVNNRSVITWKTTIEPEECFKPSVTYHFFTRH